MKEKRVRELFDLLDDYDDSVKIQVATAIGYTATIDGVIQPSETPYLTTMLKILKEQEIDTMPVAKAFMNIKKRPVLTPIELSEKHAEAVYKFVLEISASDQDLSPQEMKYLTELSKALGISNQDRLKLVDQTVKKSGIDPLSLVLQDLNQDERYWIGIVILKSIYADERIDPSEAQYLEKIYQMFRKDNHSMQKVQQDAQHRSLDDLPPVHFTPEISEKILQQLIVIFQSDNTFDEKEIRVLEEISSVLGISRPRLNQLISGDY